MSAQVALDNSIETQKELYLNWTTESGGSKQSAISNFQRQTVEITMDAGEDFPKESVCEVKIARDNTVAFLATKLWVRKGQDGKKTVGLSYETTPLDAFQIYCFLNENG